ncbi:hypothetical protein L0668_08265 [Paraglaciecola aquimarina]|uniref:Uncharacterized protein n=1 Tax=Paraglaciecola algarum TaxID=3050085 RepID=A0ABS9D5E1_9ALTE|nr:hypothetical protein [Paraglaciecola sp. G1-23]MCF2948096.1 hypothetical protein [Paraglaciecola sp. G1-23]
MEDLPTNILTFEEKIKREPDSEDILGQLLMAYATPDFHSHRNKVKHILTYITLYPTHASSRCPWVYINHEKFPKEFKQVENIWKQHLTAQPNNLKIVQGVANFYSTFAPILSTNALQNFANNNPTEPDVWVDLGRYTLDAKERLNYYLKAKELGAKQPNLLVWISISAIDAKKFSIAENVGNELLAIVEAARAKHGEKLDWPETGKELFDKALKAIGDRAKTRDLTKAISTSAYSKHYGHTALGHVALHNKNLKQAIFHLLESGKVVSDCRLSSYGPSFLLAEDLCRQGAWDDVAIYIKYCKNILEKPRSRSMASASRATSNA